VQFLGDKKRFRTAWTHTGSRALQASGIEIWVAHFRTSKQH
jgi:hypothetical protein